MPNDGFSSITINESIYNRFYNNYKLNKEELAKQGITSFAGYITSRIHQCLKLTQINFRFKLITLQKINDKEIHHSVVIEDVWNNALVTVNLIVDSFWCGKCNKEYCIHSGFVSSLYQTYKAFGEWKVQCKK